MSPLGIYSSTAEPILRGGGGQKLVSLIEVRDS